MFKVPEQYRVRAGILTSTQDDGCNGFFLLPNMTKNGKPKLTISVSDGAGWEHVGVSLSFRTPTWEEMQYVKMMFWDEDDCVVQFHPPKSQYVNCHPFCLHLWRPTSSSIQAPPAILVGIK